MGNNYYEWIERWLNSRRAEEFDLNEIVFEVVNEYQITATSGQNPAFDATLSNVSDEENKAFDVTVEPTNATSTTNLVYSFNFDAGKKWNNESWDVPLTINWDEDPGQDIEMTVRVHKRT